MYNVPDDYIDSYSDYDGPNIHDYEAMKKRVERSIDILDEMIEDLGESSYVQDVCNELIRLKKILEG